MAPTSLLKISVSRRSAPPVVFFGFINDRMSTFWFWVFLNYFLAISCFCILRIYLLVEGRRGISPDSVSTWSLILPEASFFSLVVPALMVIAFDYISQLNTLLSLPYSGTISQFYKQMVLPWEIWGFEFRYVYRSSWGKISFIFEIS